MGNVWFHWFELSSFFFLYCLRTVKVNWKLLLGGLGDLWYLPGLEANTHVLLGECVVVGSKLDQQMEWDRNVGQTFEVNIEEVPWNASNNGLMTNHKHWVLLPFNPINQRLKSPYRVDVGLPRRVSEVNFFHGPLFGYVGMFLKDFFVGQILADSCIDLI